EESYMVDKLIRCDWMTRRFQRIEVSFWTHLRCQDSYHFHNDRYKAAPNLEGLAVERSRGDFNRLQRRMDSTHRTYMETLAALEAKAQAAAEAQEAEAEAQAQAAEKAQTGRNKSDKVTVADLIKLIKLQGALFGPGHPDSEYRDNFIPAQPESAGETETPAGEADASVCGLQSSPETETLPSDAEASVWPEEPLDQQPGPTEFQPLTPENGFLPSNPPEPIDNEQAA
ncbi:MAG TPA: hypothetical protein VMU19_01515, partial [Bryobacteraceae bacterium]|nr:hypothetical protein [Bryobacteraceae bacterium]